ncbi:natural cytotoxicity triggering receptor 1-like [Tiliqua scincoides]|uniref:natural cytotoxicity triggering receptor 1-like n=1 Tax=Tiliqua scincoides TaxID=71010 RepID=UPI003462AAB2
MGGEGNSAEAGNAIKTVAHADDVYIMVRDMGLRLTGQCWVPGETSYPKPSISVHPSETVALGGTVHIRCKNEDPNKLISEDTQMEFFLQKQTSLEFELRGSEVAGHDEVVFPFDSVAPSDAGTYRCIYCYKTYTCQAWSRYSERVNISIRGQIHPKSSTPVNASEKNNNDDIQPVGTYIRLGAVSLVLLALVLILSEAMYSWRKGHL